MIDEIAVENILDNLSKGDYGAFSSEAQLRDAFSIELGRKFPNCVIYPEYTQPKPLSWRCSENLIHFDLLVLDKSNNESILFEFKYKPKKCEVSSGGLTLYLRDNSDTTNGRYAIWRDIYRIETFVDLNKITKGFIIFITNNSKYYRVPKLNELSYEFSIAPGLHVASDKTWVLEPGKTISTTTSIGTSYRKDIFPLPIKNDYYFNYEKYSSLTGKDGKIYNFYKLVVPIHSSSYNSEIETVLRRIGKENFVKYFSEFANEGNDECKKILIRDGFSKNSSATIVNNSKKIFKEGKENEALRNIIASSKVSNALRAKAKTLLIKWITLFG